MIKKLEESTYQQEENQNESQIEKISESDEDQSNLLMSSLLDREGVKIVSSLRKSMISDNVYKFKTYLLNLHNRQENQKMPLEAQIAFLSKSGILKTFQILKNHIFKNLNEPSLYSLFSAFQDFLTALKPEENLQKILNLEKQKINEWIDLLKDTMEDIIYKQIKMKNSRRNLKTKLRLQRRLNEIKNQVEILQNLKTEN